jgi:hypothetical protein
MIEEGAIFGRDERRRHDRIDLGQRDPLPPGAVGAACIAQRNAITIGDGHTERGRCVEHMRGWWHDDPHAMPAAISATQVTAPARVRRRRDRAECDRCGVIAAARW